MKPDEIRKLLGGFATGTLTAHEREALFSAALEDQELFDALAKEEALRELLADPVTREELLEELHTQPAERELHVAAARSPVNASVPLRAESAWAWLTPGRLAFAGALAAVVLVIGIFQYTRVEKQQPVEVAMAPARGSVVQPASPSTALPPVQLKKPETALPPPVAQSTDRFRDTVEKRESDAEASPEPTANALRDQAAAAVAPQTAKDLALESQARPAEEAAAGQTAVASPSAAPPPPPARVLRAVPAPTGFALSARAVLRARITDVTGAVINIDAGRSSGIRVGETLEILRDNRVLGAIRITEVRDTVATGTFQPARLDQEAGDVRGNVARKEAGPRVGDLVRRPAATPAR